MPKNLSSAELVLCFVMSKASRFYLLLIKYIVTLIFHYMECEPVCRLRVIYYNLFPDSQFQQKLQLKKKKKKEREALGDKVSLSVLLLLTKYPLTTFRDLFIEIL